MDIRDTTYENTLVEKLRLSKVNVFKITVGPIIIVALSTGIDGIHSNMIDLDVKVAFATMLIMTSPSATARITPVVPIPR